MKNTYETADVAELGNAEHLILGAKFLEPTNFDWILGPGFALWMQEDIDESDE